MIGRALVGCVFAGLAASIASAQPVLSSSYWNSSLSFNACMAQAAAVLRDLGFTNIQAAPTAQNGLYGDYSTQVLCITAKGVVMVIVGGPDASTASDLRGSIATKLGAK